MPRAGLSRERVVRAAGELADEEGYPGLTLAALAQRLGVRQPSLYKHLDSLGDLQRSVRVAALRELGDTLAGATVGRSGAEAVRALAAAYRGWVLDHPGRYAATVRAPSDAADAADDQHASDRLVTILLDVLAGLGLGDAAAIDAARTLRSALHGFVDLETRGAFGLPRPVSDSYDVLVETLVAGLTWQATGPTTRDS